MGEDQDAAGLRGLHEAQRRHRLAGAGRMLKPEALRRVGVLGLVGEHLLLVLVHPVERLLVALLGLLGVALGEWLELVLEVAELLLFVLLLVLVLLRDPGSLVVLILVREPNRLVLLGLDPVLVILPLLLPPSPSSRAAGRAERVGAPSAEPFPLPRIAAEASSSGEAAAAARPLPLPLPLERSASASSAVRVPESASTWWAESTVPSRSRGSWSESTLSRPNSSENSRRHAVEG